MRCRTVYLLLFLCFSSITPFPIAAKEGVLAIVHTVIPAAAEYGSQIDINWTLSLKDDGKPFTACNVFIRLIGPTGDSSEAFAKCGVGPVGRFNAIAVIPRGGVSTIEIGVAGTSTEPRSGHSERSDWLIPLANDPIQK